jgi:hypothetical protein
LSFENWGFKSEVLVGFFGPGIYKLFTWIKRYLQAVYLGKKFVAVSDPLYPDGAQVLGLENFSQFFDQGAP